ncbi:MAG: Hsp20/alpha crystallin family protein [Nocardioides sp.]
MSVMNRERRGLWPWESLWTQDLVEGTFRDMLRGWFTGEHRLDQLFEGGMHLMRIEEFVEDDTCVIRAELPGIDPDKDVDIRVVDGALHLKAERQETTEEDRPDGYRSEFHYGSLIRNIRRPEGATEADVSATYTDGILEVRIPMPAPHEPDEGTKIPVSRS